MKIAGLYGEDKLTSAEGMSVRCVIIGNGVAALEAVRRFDSTIRYLAIVISVSRRYRFRVLHLCMCSGAAEV